MEVFHCTSCGVDESYTTHPIRHREGCSNSNVKPEILVRVASLGDRKLILCRKCNITTILEIEEKDRCDTCLKSVSMLVTGIQLFHKTITETF